MRPIRPSALPLLCGLILAATCSCSVRSSPTVSSEGREGEFTEVTGAEPTSGIVLPDVERAAVQVQIHLGPSDLKSPPIAVILEWYTDATDCGIQVATRIVSHVRLGCRR